MQTDLRNVQKGRPAPLRSTSGVKGKKNDFQHTFKKSFNMTKKHEDS